MFGFLGIGGLPPVRATTGGAGFAGFVQIGGLAGMVLGMTTSWQSPSSFTQMAMGAPAISLSGGMYGYLGGSNTDPFGSYRAPIYRDRYEKEAVYKYEEHKAWYYQFQQGEKHHQTSTDVQTQVRQLPRPRDPVILDINEDGQLGVTGKDDSRRRVNEQTRVQRQTRREGWREITTTTTTREWDLLVNWDKKIDFDVDGDGKVNRTEWLRPGGGDGFLVYDADGDGVITGRELMNETGLKGEQNQYKDGWEKARDLFDKDGDGVLQGEELAGLKVWMDRNGDGVTDPGELRSLADLGIVKIDTVKGSFTKKKLSHYRWIKHRELLGYVEHNVMAAAAGNIHGVGSRIVLGGQVLHNYQLGALV